MPGATLVMELLATGTATQTAYLLLAGEVSQSYDVLGTVTVTLSTE